MENIIFYALIGVVIGFLLGYIFVKIFGGSDGTLYCVIDDEDYNTYFFMEIRKNPEIVSIKNKITLEVKQRSR